MRRPKQNDIGGKIQPGISSAKGKMLCAFWERDQPLSRLISPHLLLSFSCLPQRQLCSPAPYKNITTTTKKEMTARVFFLAAGRSCRAGLGAGRGFCSGCQIPSSGCQAQCRRLPARGRWAPPLPCGTPPAVRPALCPRVGRGSHGRETECGPGGTQGKAIS